MRATRMALAAFIAAVACTDSSTPATAPSAAIVAPIKTPPATSPSTAPASFFSGYSPRSPHWPHITTMMTDFYYAWTPTERAWAGTHYDYAMSGAGSAWRAANPTVVHIPYALLWTVLVAPSAPNIQTGYYADMKTWFRAHPQYSLEKAFAHRPGAARDSAGRSAFSIWGSRRWAINPLDPGAVAYTVNRLQRAIAAESGVFLDEVATGTWGSYLGATSEVGASSAYSGAIARLLGTLHKSAPGKIIMLNTAEYISAADRANTIAAGAAHMELINNFEYSGMISRWVYIESLNAAGVMVDMVSAYGSQNLATMTNSYPRGNSATNVQRAKLWELASYYMVVPASPRLLALQLENLWSKPYSTLWIKAQEANIGHPRAPRKQAKIGADPQGNSYIVYTREFDRALVVLRLQQGWSAHTYGDATAITFALPAGQTWIPLNADGTVGAAVTSVRLRNSEAAIFLKAGTM